MIENSLSLSSNKEHYASSVAQLRNVWSIIQDYQEKSKHKKGTQTCRFNEEFTNLSTDAISDITQNKSNHLHLDSQFSSMVVSGNEEILAELQYDEKLELSSLISLWAKKIKSLQYHLQGG